MRIKIFIVSCLVLLLISFFYSQVLALKEETHKTINMNIAERDINGFSLDTYLIHNLGFTDGYKQKLDGLNASGGSVKQSIAEWLGYGGEQEDRPGSNLDYILNRPARSNNHFHNPLRTTWDIAGLNDTVFGRTYTGQSSVLWAQNTNQSLGGNWSWQDAREYFYIALTGKDFSGSTVAPMQANREQYFAYTFRAVGQQMHLVEDASVPEHVRNAAHPEIATKYYEGHVLDFQTKLEYRTLWNDLLANPITFDKSILTIASTHPSAPVPISRIIDTDLYTGDNPNVTTTLYNSPQPIGIAEYTNANFLSKDTMFTVIDPLHSFNYPNVANTVLWIDNNNREYVKKVGSGDTINHLAVSSWLYPFRRVYFPQYTEKLPVGLDEECYKEYATNLIPGDVGYSAGLLNYFFRGDIDAVPDDATGHGGIIVNNTEENMNGTFEIYYDKTNGDRIRIWSGDFALDSFSSGNNKSSNITFTPPTDAAKSCKYILVFRGQMGNEEDAVVGKVIE